MRETLLARFLGLALLSACGIEPGGSAEVVVTEEAGGQVTLDLGEDRSVSVTVEPGQVEADTRLIVRRLDPAATEPEGDLLAFEVEVEVDGEGLTPCNVTVHLGHANFGDVTGSQIVLPVEFRGGDCASDPLARMRIDGPTDATSVAFTTTAHPGEPGVYALFPLDLAIGLECTREDGSPDLAVPAGERLHVRSLVRRTDPGDPWGSAADSIAPSGTYEACFRLRDSWMPEASPALEAAELASDHRDPPCVVADATADINDQYTFEALDDDDEVLFIMTVFPVPEGVFCDAVEYVIEVSSEYHAAPPAGGGGPGPLVSVGPLANVEFVNTRRFDEDTTGPSDSLFDGPFLVAAGVREGAPPVPPGFPPGPPQPPQPLVSVVFFDEAGEEVTPSLVLGVDANASLSAAVLSHVDALGSGQLQQAAPQRVDELICYGGIPLTTTAWNPGIDDWGILSVSPQVTNVTDVSPYGGDPESGGAVIVWFGGQRLFFHEYDPSIQIFTTAPGAEITSSQFAGASGGPVSAFRWQVGGQTLFVTDGQPGELWSHPGTGTLAQASADATKIGSLGNGPRQIRFQSEIGVVTNFDSGTLSIVRRQGNGTVTILGTVNVGDGPIGVDLRVNGSGNIEVLSAGFNDHTYTLTVLSAAGSPIGTPTTRAVPGSGRNPVHAVFANKAGTRIAVSCNGSDEILVFDLPAS